MALGVCVRIYYVTRLMIEELSLGPWMRAKVRSCKNLSTRAEIPFLPSHCKGLPKSFGSVNLRSWTFWTCALECFSSLADVGE